MKGLTEHAVHVRWTMHLLSDDLHQHTLAPAPVEFTVKDLLPRTEVEPAFRNGDDDFAAHDLTLDMGIAVILAGLVMLIRCLVRSQALQKRIVVPQQSGLIIVDIDTGRDMHGVDQDQSFPHAALLHHRLDLRRDVEIGPARGRLKPQFFPKGFHAESGS